jgi:hypothetical protein
LFHTWREKLVSISWPHRRQRGWCWRLQRRRRAAVQQRSRLATWL